MLELREDTIFTLHTRPEERATSRADWLWLTLLVVLGWLAAVSFIGRYRGSQVTRGLAAFVPPDVGFWGSLTILILLALASALAGRRRWSGAAWVMAAFVLGHQGYAALYLWLPTQMSFPFDTFGDALQFAFGRLAYGAALVVPMLIACRLAFPRDTWPPLMLGVGDVSVATRDVSAKTPPIPAWRQLAGGYAAFSIVFFLVMQANVGFAPVVEGTLWPLIPAVLVAAVANAVAEEYVFRGVLQPAFIRSAGVAAGLWMQGLLFGVMHWGMSIGFLAALPVSLLIGLGSVVWGKAALDTRGMLWVIVAHAMVDVGLMSAFFVPH